MADILTAETLAADKIIVRADAATVQRGRTYFSQGRTRLEHLEPTEAIYQVRGTEDYRVAVTLSKGKARIECDCPLEGDETAPCKHCIATLLALNACLRRNPPVTWETVLSKAIAPGVGVSKTGLKRVLFFSLQKTYSHWAVLPYSLALTHFPPDTDIDNADASAHAIAKEHLGRHAKPVRSPGVKERFVNMTDGSRLAVQVAVSAQRYAYSSYGGDDDTASLLGSLGGSIVFRGTEQNPCMARLDVLRDAGQPELHIADGPDGSLHLRAQVRVGEDVLALDADTTEHIADGPTWLCIGSRLLTVNDMDGTFAIFTQTPELSVPPEQKDAFLTRYLLPLAERFPITGITITQDDMQADPIPRLYLTEDQGIMQATLHFGYGEYELEFERDTPETALRQKPDTMTLVRIVRQTEQEERWGQQMSQFGLKRGPAWGVFVLRAKVDVLDFLVRHVPKLTEAGVEVYGEGDLASARINRSRPTLSFKVSSGIDWFDVEAVADYGGLEVTLQEIRHAVRRRERFVKLSDGTLGVIPEDWLARYRHLFGLAEETETGLRVGMGQVALLDQLEAQGDTVQADALFADRRERLRGFTQIAPQTLPQQLGGVLRPYQKAGYDWLHFLHDYGFGGCLADDMGTGKTFTTLAFLQALKERGETQHASLLVLPRSLVFNWEREAARWTPGLRLLNQAHVGRAKNPASFDEYDLVLTTYGLLLRDIEALRAYLFHYAVLDEAQAIKNPLSQTGRAARLIQAEHRLTLTGTPVENSTLELWSQFAFLSPGLLGTLEYFGTEFAAAIEKRRDEAAAALLRKMVHPFILRRTKDQVAPDLPPRTERIVYTEMEPAQRKLYEQKRDFYRAQVLGLIEKDGMDNARMKILEGLLRLRQISCHPRLAEPHTRIGSGKFEALMDTLETLRAEGHKALVFSQFVQMLTIVREALDMRGIHYAYLDGRVKNRQERVDTFQNDPDLPFFLISLKAGGVGLNLTAADYVIHIDPWWNPAVEMQATDRAHRIGQQKPVFVQKLIAQETVEEKILVLQDRKRALVTQLVATESGFFKSLTRQDVETLFE